MESLLFAPPIVFIIYVAVFLAGSKGLSHYSKTGRRDGEGLDSYACGQRNIQDYVNPDYSEFFPFAFFFTIMHVLVLVIATAPYDAPVLPIMFVLVGILSMVIIFKR